MKKMNKGVSAMRTLFCFCIGLLSYVAMPAVAQEKVAVEVDTLWIVRVPEKKVLGKVVGTLAKLIIKHPTKQLAGLDIKASSISFTDSTGKDLFAAGKKQKKQYERNTTGFSFSTNDKVENRISLAEREFHDRKNASPNEVIIQLHALAVPSKASTSLSVKGKLVLNAKGDKRQSLEVPPSVLRAKHVIQLGSEALTLEDNGSGSCNNNQFIDLVCRTSVVLESVAVIGKEGANYLVILNKGSGPNPPSLQVFTENLTANDLIKITYSIPEKKTADIDVKIDFGFAAPKLTKKIDGNEKTLTSNVLQDGVYVAYSNGIVKDTKTGLEWKAGPDRDTNWNEAKSWVQNLNLDGGGWRMPTMDELEGLYNKGAGDFNMTSLLKISGPFVWSGETKGSSVAGGFTFSQGNQFWGNRGIPFHKRAFAVRSRNDG